MGCRALEEAWALGGPGRSGSGGALLDMISVCDYI